MGRRGRLCSRLASVLARHPSLLRDLPALLLSIDRGNATPISHLDSRSQRALVSLLETLPVREVEVDDQRRWVREGKESLVGVVLAAMTDKRLIRDENRLLPSERMATEVLERLLPHLGDNNRDVKGVLQDLAGIGSASLPQSPENNWVTGLSDAAVSIGLQRCDGTLTIPSGDGERERLSSRFDGIFAPFLAHIFGEDNRGRKLVLVLAFRILHGIKLYEILGEVETMQRLLNYDLMT